MVNKEAWFSEEFKEACDFNRNYSGCESYNDVVKSVNYDQHIILHDIMMLHNDGKPFDCDMTYSKGVFYGTHKVQDERGVRIISIPPPIINLMLHRLIAI